MWIERERKRERKRESKGEYHFIFENQTCLSFDIEGKGEYFWRLVEYWILMFKNIFYC